jgi:hypothetical protein
MDSNASENFLGDIIRHHSTNLSAGATAVMNNVPGQMLYLNTRFPAPGTDANTWYKNEINNPLIENSNFFATDFMNYNPEELPSMEDNIPYRTILYVEKPRDISKFNTAIQILHKKYQDLVTSCTSNENWNKMKIIYLITIFIVLFILFLILKR